MAAQNIFFSTQTVEYRHLFNDFIMFASRSHTILSTGDETPGEG